VLYGVCACRYPNTHVLACKYLNRHTNVKIIATLLGVFIATETLILTVCSLMLDSRVVPTCNMGLSNAGTVPQLTGMNHTQE